MSCQVGLLSGVGGKGKWERVLFVCLTYDGDGQGRGRKALNDFAEFVGVDAEAGKGFGVRELGVGFWAEVCWVAATAQFISCR